MHHIGGDAIDPLDIISIMLVIYPMDLMTPTACHLDPLGYGGGVVCCGSLRDPQAVGGIWVHEQMHPIPYHSCPMTYIS